MMVGGIVMNAEDLILTPGSGREAQIVAEMARDTIEAGLGWSWTPQRVARAVRRPDVTLLLARDDQALAGFGMMAFGDDAANLLLFSVAPAWRGHGVGRRMLTWLETSARVGGIQQVGLEVRVSNVAARAFYAKMGYRETEILRGYYRGRESAVRMVHRFVWSRPREEMAWEVAIDELLSGLPDAV